MASFSLETVQAKLESLAQAALDQDHILTQENLATPFRSEAPGDEFLGSPFQDHFADFLRKLYDGYGRRIYEVWRIKSKNKLPEMKVLHLAALLGHTHLCKALIHTFGYNVNAKSSEKSDTPLHIATWANRAATVACLIDLGADVNNKGHMEYTPLHIASTEGHQELVQLLISRGSDTEASSAIGTPLQCAANKSQIMTMTVLLENKVNPNSASHCILTPLLLSVINNSSECLMLLTKAGADPDTGACGTTPLCYAAFHGLTEIVQCLINAGANPDAMDLYGSTALENAALNGKIDCMASLFPFTSPIPFFPYWSLSGIAWCTSSSADYKQQREIKKTGVYLTAKREADDAARRKEYFNAIQWYSLAISTNCPDITVYSNRSLCFIRLFDGVRALSDAKSCVRMKPDWPKAHCLEGSAWKLLGNYPKALDAFSKALMLDPDNRGLLNMIQSTRREMSSRR